MLICIEWHRNDKNLLNQYFYRYFAATYKETLSL
jgi:hypothetical protein